MRSLILIVFILSIANGYTQNNIVLNGSFEQVNGCPSGNFYPITEGYIPHVSNPNFYSPDYYNNCYTMLGWQYYVYGVPSNIRGWQNARTGNAYVGLDLWEKNANLSEYVQIKLNDSLKAEHHYAFECFLSRAERFRYATANFGVYFSNDSVAIATDILPFTPQISNATTNYLTDTTGWMPITGTYQAHGGEKYLILGNFNDSTQAVDTLYQYFILNAANNYQQGPYCVNWAYYYIDDVSLIDLDSTVAVEEIGSLKDDFSFTPNPANSNVTVKYSGNYKSIAIQEISGRIVYSQNINAALTSLVIDVAGFANGIYIIKITGDNISTRSKLIINH